LRTLF